MSNKNLETRTLLGEIRNFDKGSVFFYLGHPLLNRIAHCFIKAAGIGAIQAVPHEAYFTALEGEEYRERISTMGTGCWNVPGLTYGLKEARGTHDWVILLIMKNSAVAGAITGVSLALTSDNSSLEQIVQSAITGAAISTAANVLAGIF